MMTWLPVGSMNTLWILSSLKGSSISTFELFKKRNLREYLLDSSGLKSCLWKQVQLHYLLPISILTVCTKHLTACNTKGSGAFPLALFRVRGIGIRLIENIALGSSLVLSKEPCGLSSRSHSSLDLDQNHSHRLNHLSQTP